MSLSIARLANAISRLAVAHYATRDPKPVVKYGAEWHPPIGSEKLVHYIWRHRPADFEERYMVKIDDPKSYPFNLEHQIEADYTYNLKNDDGKNEDGKYPPPPTPEYRRNLIAFRGRVEGEG